MRASASVPYAFGHRVVSRSPFYRPELDVLRFCAAFAVFLFHALRNANFWIAHGTPRLVAVPAVTVISAGRFGVDLFFVLSSFLITELLLREREATGFIDVGAFYIRRVLRIWPLYFFMIGVAYGITFVEPSQHFGGKYIAGYLLLFGNWVVVLFSFPESIAIPLWSVSIEEQFYLVWPLVLKKARLRTIAKIAWGLIAVSFCARLMLAAWGARPDAVWCNTFARLDPIAAGVLYSICMRGRDLQLSKIKRVGLTMVGLGAFCFAARCYQAWHGWGILVAYPAATIASVSVLAAAHDAPRFGLHVFERTSLIYLGKISYGIYVYHMLGLLTAQRILGDYGKHAIGSVLYSSIGLAFTIILAALSYRFLESPFLRLKSKFARVASRPV
jgi:peptidoglycan/LPS O-acetylase OafA/YrhL